MPDYDIEGAFRAIENELLDSMIRNLKNHRAEETDEGFEWTSWQTEQLNALNKYKSKNNKVFKKRFAEINSKIEKGIRESKKLGSMDEEISILDAIKKGFKATKQSNTMQAQFFKVNERKLDALIKATKNDMRKAETAMLRMANDQYRKVIFNAQVYANTGAGTYEQAVDMATKDFLSRGINCIEYKNGARVNIASYAAMAIRTANTRAYLQGEGEKRQEWGISTVIVNKRGNPCLKCLKWVGKVLIDDVWSGGKASDGPYPLMSTAMAQGLYHHNCKDGHTTFFPGITEEPKPLTRKDIDKSVEAAREEQKQQYAQRQADRFQRLADYSLDEENQRRYSLKANEWNNELSQIISGGNDRNKVYPITESSIANVPLIETDEITGEIANRIRQAHKEVLEIAMSENNSWEVAKLFNSGFNEIDTVLGTATEIDLNVPGRSKAKYVIHNHPNNRSFSSRDIIWLINNEQVKFFSIVKNNGSVEMIFIPDNFDKDRFKVEYYRQKKKFEKDIANNEQKGYDKVISNLLRKTKSGLIYKEG